MTLTPREILTHPVGAAATVFTTLTMAFQFHSLDVLAMFIWGNLGQLSTVAAIIGFTVIGEIELGTFQWLGEGIKILAIFLLMAFVAKVLLGLFNELRKRLT